MNEKKLLYISVICIGLYYSGKFVLVSTIKTNQKDLIFISLYTPIKLKLLYPILNYYYPTKSDIYYLFLFDLVVYTNFRRKGELWP